MQATNRPKSRYGTHATTHNINTYIQVHVTKHLNTRAIYSQTSKYPSNMITNI